MRTPPADPAALSGLEKIVDEVIENRRGLIDGQKRKSGYLKSGEKSGITRQFGKVELVSLIRLIIANLNQAIEREARETLQRAIRETATALPDNPVVMSCPGCGAEW